MEARVSFVVTNYNYGRFVAQGVDSLLDQTLGALEVIVVDDASTDDSLLVLERYASEPRVRVIRHTSNQGFIASLNEGLAVARGEYLGLLDADDFCLRTDAVERQVAVLDAHPEVGFVYSASMAVDEDGRPLRLLQRWESDYLRDGWEELDSLLFECYVQHSGALVRRTCHVAIGDYDPQLPHAGDWDRWLRLAARFSVGYIADPLFAYRIHRKSMQQSSVSPRQANGENVVAVHKVMDSLPATAPATLRRLRGPAVRAALLATSVPHDVPPRTGRLWAGLLDGVRRLPVLVVSHEFHRALARLLLLSALGYRRYHQILRWRRARLGARPAPRLEERGSASGLTVLDRR